MGIMTSGASQFVTACLLTLAQRKCFHLCNRAKTGFGGAGMNKGRGIVRQEFPRTELRKLFSPTVDQDFSFQAALLANRVTAQRIEFGGIEDSLFAAARYVPSRIALAGFPSDARLQQPDRAITVRPPW